MSADSLPGENSDGGGYLLEMTFTQIVLISKGKQLSNCDLDHQSQGANATVLAHYNKLNLAKF